MIGVPYGMFGLIGVMVYRHLRAPCSRQPAASRRSAEHAGSIVERTAHGRGMFLKAKRTGTSTSRSGA